MSWRINLSPQQTAQCAHAVQFGGVCDHCGCRHDPIPSTPKGVVPLNPIILSAAAARVRSQFDHPVGYHNSPGPMTTPVSSSPPPLPTSKTAARESPIPPSPLEHALNQLTWARDKILIHRRSFSPDTWTYSVLSSIAQALDRDNPKIVNLFKENPPMDLDTFRAFADKFLSEQSSILESKGNDYADRGDRLINFKRIGERLGVGPMAVWATYFMKHVDAILTFVRDGEVASEPIRGRFLDVANYALLGAALAEELERSKEAR